MLKRDLDAAIQKAAKTPGRPIRAELHQPRMTEAQFQRQVLALAKMTGWRTAHFRPAMNARGDWRTPVAGDGKGFPDLLLVRGGKLLAVELKTDRGTLSPEQREWRDALLAAGVDWRLWRPRDWDAIEATLKGEA